MPKVSRTYRIEQETADRIADISESEGKTATEVVEAAIRAYSSEEYAGNLAAVGTFIVTFLDSYEIKFRIRRRARTVRDEGRRGRRSKK